MISAVMNDDNEQTEMDTAPQEAAEGEAPPQDPQLAQAINKVIQAGLRILYSQETRKMLTDGLTQDAPIGDVLSQEVAGLMKVMDDRAQGKIPRKAIIPAAVALMQDLVAFVKETGIAQPTDDDMKAALQKVVLLLVDQFKPDTQGAATPQQQPVQQPPAPQQQPMGMIGGQQ